MNRSDFLRGALASALATAPLTLWAAGAHDDPLVDVVAGGKGRINYSADVVKASGRGAPPVGDDNPGRARLMAIGAARADALRNLAMAVSSIQVSAETTVRNYVVQDDTIRTKVQALLSAPRVVEESVAPDGTATVVMELPLHGKGSVAAAILPRIKVSPAPAAELEPAPQPVVLRPEPTARPAPAVRPPRPRAVKAGLAYTSRDDDGPFTSVIVDCRGLDIQGILSPKLYDAAGDEVYGTMHVDIDFAIETGIVGYPRTVREAIQNRRAGDHPLIVPAVGVQDRFRMNPVISVEDARRVRRANEATHFLDRCQVIFLCDPVR